MDEKLIKREPIGRDRFLYVSRHHTFGTDAVLLADFASARQDDRLVDLGTGCGIIPFILLRDGKLSEAVGVDISEEAVQLSRRTSHEWGMIRFEALHADLEQLKGRLPFGYYSLVTCNPPYKAPGAGFQNVDTVCRTARHEVACTLRGVVAAASGLLQTAGRFCICQRPERLAELICLMTEYRVEPKRLRFVCQRQGKEPWLVLVEGRKGGHSGLRVMPTLYVEQDGTESEEMLRIYGCYKEAKKP